MNSRVVELTGISQRFATHWALRDIGLVANKGDCIAILGPNGCGKSTLLKILATLLEPTTGGGTIAGFDIRQNTLKIRNQVEWLGHELGLYKTLTAEENLKFSCVIKGRKPLVKKLREAMAEVGLNAVGGKPIASFSVGLRKRLSLARILLESPEFVLLDEPHANLDREGKTLMNRCIQNWKKGGLTLLLASHDHHEVLPLCDKAMVLNQGRVAYFGDPKNIPSSVIL